MCCVTLYLVLLYLGIKSGEMSAEHQYQAPSDLVLDRMLFCSVTYKFLSFNIKLSAAASSFSMSLSYS